MRRWRQARIRSTYLKALQLSSPEKLIEIVAKSMKGARALPDTDALEAQASVLAYVLYGCEEAAIRALARVNWKSKPPLIQAVGLSAEGFVGLWALLATMFFVLYAFVAQPQ